MKTAVLFFCLVALVNSQSTPVSQCIYQGGSLPINTYIEGCGTPPCLLPQLQDAILNIIFRAPHTIRSMRTLATAYVLGPIGVNYDLGDEAVTCNYLTNTYCPVLANEVVEYTLRMYIEPTFPAGLPVTIEFRIEDENNTPFACFRASIAITTPNTKTALTNNTITIDNYH